MENLLKKFGIKKLTDVPFIKGKIATEKEFKAGKAIFYLHEDSKPSKINIPCFAYAKKLKFFKTLVVICQAEDTDSGTVLGVRYKDGKSDICMMEDIELIY